MTSPWTIDRVAELRRMAALGWSAGRIATEMGIATRNTVSGAAHRRGIPLTGGPGGGARSQRPRAARRAALDMNRVARLSGQASAPVAAPEPPKGNPIEFMELTNRTCRFPVVDAAPWMFCGAPEADLLSEQPYCPYHHRATHGHWQDISAEEHARRSAHGYKMLAAGKYVAGHGITPRGMGPKDPG